MRYLLLCAIVVIGLGADAASASMIYNAVTDFDGQNNPSGAWSYLYASTVGGTLTPLPQVTNYDGTGLGWFLSGLGSPHDVYVARNPGPGNIVFSGTVVQPPGLLEVDPQGWVADVRWTAPAAGIYNVDGLFQIIDVVGSQHEVEILQDYNAAGPLLNSPIAGYGTQLPFDFDRTFAAGETLDFIVASTDGSNFLSTGLSATVTAVPEPITLSAFGLCGVVLVLRRPSRKRAR